MHEGFLELVDNMLTSDVGPTVFSLEDKEAITPNVSDDVVRQDLFDSPENCWRVFIDRCRDNLHIVLCFSPSRYDLRRQCRDFSGLFNNTVIDGFDPWPEEARSAVPKHFLEQESTLIPESGFQSIVSRMVIAR
jgi:dynein heavy chain